MENRKWLHEDDGDEMEGGNDQNSVAACKYVWIEMSIIMFSRKVHSSCMTLNRKSPCIQAKIGNARCGNAKIGNARVIGLEIKLVRGLIITHRRAKCDVFRYEFAMKSHHQTNRNSLSFRFICPCYQQGQGQGARPRTWARTALSRPRPRSKLTWPRPRPRTWKISLRTAQGQGQGHGLTSAAFSALRRVQNYSVIDVYGNVRFDSKQLLFILYHNMHVSVFSGLHVQFGYSSFFCPNKSFIQKKCLEMMRI